MRTTDCNTESETADECRKVHAGLRLTAPCKVHEHESESADTSPSPRYVAGWNLAGYLPEVEPQVFGTLGEAADYLREVAAQWWDSDADIEGAPTEAAQIDEGETDADGWYGDIHLWAEPYTHTHYGYGEDPRVCAECGETY